MGMRRRMVGAVLAAGVAVTAVLGSATAAWADTADGAEVSVELQPGSPTDVVPEAGDLLPPLVDPTTPAVVATPQVDVLDPGGSSVVDPGSGGTIVLGPAGQASSVPSEPPVAPVPAPAVPTAQGHGAGAGPIVLGPAVQASVVTRTLSPGTVAVPDGSIVLGPAVEASVRTRVLSTGSSPAPRAEQVATPSTRSVPEAAAPAERSVQDSSAAQAVGGRSDEPAAARPAATSEVAPVVVDDTTTSSADENDNGAAGPVVDGGEGGASEAAVQTVAQASSDTNRAAPLTAAGVVVSLGVALVLARRKMVPSLGSVAGARTV